LAAPKKYINTLYRHYTICCIVFTIYIFILYLYTIYIDICLLYKSIRNIPI